MRIMKDLRTKCWRFHRKITALIVIFSGAYFMISVLLTKSSMSNQDVQGSFMDTFHGKGRMDQGVDGHPKNSKNLNRLPHNINNGDGVKGLAQGHHHGNKDGQQEDEFSSSATSSSEHNAQQSEKGSKPTKHLPQAIIIGVKKGGTRALLDFISLHPDVVPAKQEVHYFDRNYDKGLDWYREQMPLTRPGQITIEKTPSYFFTESVPERVQEFDKDVKLILVLRDPVVRAISDFAQSVATGRRKPGEFDRLAVPDPKTGEVDANWYSIQVGLYDVHLERWLKHFPLSQFVFINGDELISKPATQLIKLQEFLKIDTVIDERSFVFNATKGFYCVKKTAEQGAEEEMKCLGDTKGRAHPQVSASVLHHMRLFFQSHNDRLYSMMGENFHWGEEDRRR